MEIRPKKHWTNMKSYGLCIHPDLMERLQEAADKHGTTRRQVILQLIEQGLEKLEENDKPAPKKPEPKPTKKKRK